MHLKDRSGFAGPPGATNLYILTLRETWRTYFIVAESLSHAVAGAVISDDEIPEHSIVPVQVRVDGVVQLPFIQE